MTILEKFELDHPNQKEIYAIFGDVVQSYCPRHFYDITNIDSCGNGGKHPCKECWNREFPEGDTTKKRSDKKGENYELR